MLLNANEFVAVLRIMLTEDLKIRTHRVFCASYRLEQPKSSGAAH